MQSPCAGNFDKIGDAIDAGADADEDSNWNLLVF
jgi:hypothetical protein